jgi:pimeloyl-ACP methyl ester carboxylesterase
MLKWIFRLFGALLLLSALAMAWSRALNRPVDSLVARWARPPSELVQIKGQRVHLRDEGPRDDPAPIILLHGLSASLHTWEGWVNALQGERRVITIDLPGFGLTGPFTGQYKAGDYSGDAVAGFVVDVANHLKLQDFVIGGNSWGGEVAWRVAAQLPQRVKGLILVDALGPAFQQGTAPLGWLFVRIPGVNRLTQWVLPRSIVAEGLSKAYGDPKKITPSLIDRYFELTLREGNRRALVQMAQQFKIGADAARINTLRVPTLILWGDKDRLIPLSVGQTLNQRIAGSRLVRFEKLGHVPQEEDPALSIVPVREFLGLQPVSVSATPLR